MSLTPPLPSPRDLLMVDTSRRSIPIVYGIITRIIRPLLILIILGVVTIIFLWPWNDHPLTPPSEVTKEVSDTTNDLIAPKFSSTDKKGNPFTLTAARAVQVKDKPDLLNLDQPTGTITIASGMTITGSAPSGLYNQNTTELRLSGGIVFETSDGYRATLDHLDLNAKTREIVGETPLYMTGPLGTLTAQSMTGNLTTGVLILTGPATIILNEGI